MSHLVQDFKQEFGEDKFQEALAKAGHHSQETGTMALKESTNPPSGNEERLVFALMEAVDYTCYDYDDSKCLDLSEEEVKGFLKMYSDRVLEMDFEPPSMLGLMAGAFDFLQEGDGQ